MNRENQKPVTICRSRRRARRGSIYILTLGTALTVAILGMTAMMIVRIQRSQIDDVIQTGDAELYAKAALEIALLRIKNDANWRTTYSNGVWESNKSIGRGTYTLEGIDPDDGDLSDSDSDPLVITGTGIAGQATQKLQVTVYFAPPALEALKTAVIARRTCILSSERR